MASASSADCVSADVVVSAADGGKFDQGGMATPQRSPVVDCNNAEERLARSRDRNREHARRTRLRKKAQLQSLQKRVTELQDESRMLRQTVEECSIASILLGLSSGGEYKDGNDLLGVTESLSKDLKNHTFFTMNGKRKRFVSDAGDFAPKAMKLEIKGKTTIVGGGSGKTHINWKTGAYMDENGEHQQLSPEELETLRRERNRMHAKMTRDRKKVFISSVEKTITELETENRRMREILAKQAMMHSSNRTSVTPEPSPILQSQPGIPSSVPTLNPLNEVVSVLPVVPVLSSNVMTKTPIDDISETSPVPSSESGMTVIA